VAELPSRREREGTQERSARSEPGPTCEPCRRASDEAVGRSDLHAAFHEAGHFVAHHHLIPRESARELAILGGGAGIYAPGEACDGEKARERVVALYAGAAADVLLDPSREDAIRAQARHDDVEAAHCLERFGERGREPEYRARASAIVVEHWREVEGIAAMLLEVDALRGDVAKMIVDLVDGADLAAAAARLDAPPEAALVIAHAFAKRLSPERVAQVLSRHGYDARRRPDGPSSLRCSNRMMP
jgi:hypothetical protein